MTDNGPVTMRVVFHHGPADGGELVLNEPIPGVIAFPMTAVRAAVLLVNPQPPVSGSFGGSAWINVTPAGAYRLAMTPDGRVIADAQARVIYRYVPAVTSVTPATPTEGDNPDD